MNANSPHTTVHFPSFKKEAKEILFLGLPVIGAQVLQMSMGFVDTVMAGRLSATDLAAVAIGTSLMNPIIVLTIGILMALNPIVAQYFGSRRFDLIGTSVRQSLWLSQFLAWPTFFLLRNMSGVMVWLEIESHVIERAQGYLTAVSWAMPCIAAYIALRLFNEGISNTKPGMIFAFLGLLVNIPANYVLMYGKLGFPQMGAVGTGWATALVSLIMLIGLLTYTYRLKAYKRFAIFSGFKLPQWTYFKEILRIGVPNGLSAFMEVSMFAVVALLMAQLGTNAVAGHQVAINFGSIIFMIPFGLSTAITVRVGQAVGRGSAHLARFSGFTGIKLTVMLMFITAFIMFTFPQYITALYTTDVHVQEIAISLLFMAALFQLSDGFQVSGSGALRGLKDTKIPMIVNFISYWLIGIPVGYYFGLVVNKSPQGLWIGLIFGLSVAALLHNVRFHKLTKRMLAQ